MAIPPGLVCRAWVTINGVRYYARDYGKRAFCFFPTGNQQKKKKTALKRAVISKS